MTTTVPDTAERWAEALAFDAPYLVEKLMKDHVVESAEEAEALFREVKRYLVMVAADRSVLWSMYSLRVDQIWHQFILFTRQYMEYCREHFDRYIQHAPSTAPAVEDLERRTPATFTRFAEAYEQFFGEPLPGLWYDENNVTLGRCIVNPRVGTYSLHEEGEMVEWLNGLGEPVFAVDRIARAALEFIASTGSFFVRELPGDLVDEQKVALISALVEHRLLDLAS